MTASLSSRGLAAIVSHAQSALGRRLLRYSAVSVTSLILSEVLLVLFDGAFGWSAAISSTAATALATVPAYLLTRQWVWERRGRSHFLKEVAPFCLLAIIGWAFATGAVNLVDAIDKRHHVQGATGVSVIAFAYIAAYGILWLGKFAIFNQILFAHRPTGVDNRNQ